jgi:hypothetical protein
LWELEEANRRIRKNNRGVPNPETVFESILEQRLLVQNAEKLSKQVRRREKTPTTASTASISPEVAASTSSTNEIRPFPVELWEGE